MTMEEKPVELSAITRIEVITGLRLSGDGIPVLSVKWVERGIEFGITITDHKSWDDVRQWSVEIPRPTLSDLNRRAAEIAECHANSTEHAPQGEQPQVDALARELFAAAQATSGVTDLSGNFDDLSRSDKGLWRRRAAEKLSGAHGGCRAEIEKLRAALEPFASLGAKIHPDAPDAAALVLTTLDGGIIDTSNRVTVGDLRRAIAATV